MPLAGVVRGGLGNASFVTSNSLPHPQSALPSPETIDLCAIIGTAIMSRELLSRQTTSLKPVYRHVVFRIDTKLLHVSLVLQDFVPFNRFFTFVLYLIVSVSSLANGRDLAETPMRRKGWMDWTVQE
ncbi:hypothetical protein BC938DRAFT_476583 [Jimgerdemannia flammicorona]|uniref:Uncharacterized protein n=1 Tax=Jimgerdemannia flammicorona TaxID=994334 RepID=A0A433PFV2_9FUNG|nr:hypothetical protein BC938DRAFT_476583 [Jimgerdemannia flammicorona]